MAVIISGVTSSKAGSSLLKRSEISEQAFSSVRVLDNSPETGLVAGPLSGFTARDIITGNLVTRVAGVDGNSYKWSHHSSSIADTQKRQLSLPWYPALREGRGLCHWRARRTWYGLSVRDPNGRGLQPYTMCCHSPVMLVAPGRRADAGVLRRLAREQGTMHISLWSVSLCCYRNFLEWLRLKVPKWGEISPSGEIWEFRVGGGVSVGVWEYLGNCVFPQIILYIHVHIYPTDSNIWPYIGLFPKTQPILQCYVGS